MDKREFLAALWKQMSDAPKADVERSLDHYSDMIDDYVASGMSEEEAVVKIGSVESVAGQLLAEASDRKADTTAEDFGDTAAKRQESRYRAGSDTYYSTEGKTEQSTGSGNNTGNTSGGSVYSNRRQSAVYQEAYAEALNEYTGQGTPAPRRSKGMSGGKLLLLILLFPIWFPLVVTAGALIFSLFVTIWALTFSFFVVAGSFVLAGIGGAIALVLNILGGQVAAGFVTFGGGLLLAGIGILMFLIGGGVLRGVGAITRGIWRGFTGIFRRREATV